MPFALPFRRCQRGIRLHIALHFSSGLRIDHSLRARIIEFFFWKGFAKRPQYERVLAVLRETLGADALVNLKVEGAMMNADRAVEEAFAI